jgi:superfamily II DNA or RNA helicase
MTQIRGLQSVAIRSTYDSDEDDILNDFYIPCLSESTEYKRLAGFFSSSSLAVAALGIQNLLLNGGNIKIVVSPNLTEQDLRVIVVAKTDPVDYLAMQFEKDILSIENEIIKDHVAALGWLIAKGQLDIKVALPQTFESSPYQNGNSRHSLFHQKVGILVDKYGNCLSFSGSINETFSGWQANIEEFKTFRSWIEGENTYLANDVMKFDKFWSNKAKGLRVIDIPDASRQNLIDLAPPDVSNINIARHYKRRTKKRVLLFEHQKEAIQSWLEHGKRGLFEMATGTGKTFAAIGCIEQLIGKEKLLVVISCPLSHLVRQWQREITNFGLDYDKLIIADGSNPVWRHQFADGISDLEIGNTKTLILITTHTMLGKPDIIKILKTNREDVKAMLIADEVHGMGSEKRLPSLSTEFDFRLGLSATPKRWFDELGTKQIYEYFGDVIFSFGLSDAINTINPITGNTYLTPFTYQIEKVELTDDELDNYAQLSQKISKLWHSESNKQDREEHLKNLLFLRADIIKNAVLKYDKFQEIIRDQNLHDHTIIYCSDEQIDLIMNFLADQKISAHRFTMEEGTVPNERFAGLSERDYLLSRFSEGEIQILVAMKCLDEGVDIPPARNAILLSSSGNPREYIQRIGRVIRSFPGKKKSKIVDLLVIPDSRGFSAELIAAEKKILGKELNRLKEIAVIADNNAEVFRKLDSFFNGG